MQLQTTTSPIAVTRTGVCVVDGYGIRIRVERGRLVISDGIGPDRRESRFGRATAGIRRLVILGYSGYATLSAWRFLADCGIAWISLDPDGRVLGTSSSLGLDDPRLRRAQALAWGTPTGLAIACNLLTAKLDGQARAASHLLGTQVTAAEILELRPELDRAVSVERLMLVEAAAAAAYWAAWADVPIPWVRADEAKVPEGWRVVGGRVSPLTGNPRLAANPANAILNYLYAILEAEARLACLATGLDPGLGVLHADQKSRDSLALDVMEAVRPEVDAYVLGLLRSSVFRALDFHEDRRGGVRVLAPLTHRLAETAPLWAHHLAPVVERVARAFTESPGSRVHRLPTMLTETHRSVGRDALRRHPRPLGGNQKRRLDRSICRGCGRDTSTGHSWCDACRPEVKLQAGLDGLAAGRALRAELRLRGQDPAASDTAKAKLHDILRKRRAEESAWDRENPESVDPARFGRDVLPLIQKVPVRQLAAMTGLSVGYCALVRRGLRTPHARWWPILAKVASEVRATHSRGPMSAEPTSQPDSSRAPLGG